MERKGLVQELLRRLSTHKTIFEKQVEKKKREWEREREINNHEEKKERKRNSWADKVTTTFPSDRSWLLK